ncbi:hypothetical protein GOC74_05970 [Halomicrobium mukohataei]|uniref:Uncharacterized protein n=1 Tax=Halomicrobium mukohataei TaxID=57705 RepID=A0A847TTV3_9EURY|nr:hypothetical protein [Halomicrobium mukohataei]
MKSFATPGWRNRSQTYSRSYERHAATRSRATVRIEPYARDSRDRRGRDPRGRCRGRRQLRRPADSDRPQPPHGLDPGRRHARPGRSARRGGPRPRGPPGQRRVTW